MPASVDNAKLSIDELINYYMLISETRWVDTG